jgi:tetratricopeptide (TPR) repeat protein
MQTTRIPLLALWLAAGFLAACSGSQVRSGQDGAGEQAQSLLSIPDATLDALPLEHLLAAEFALREEKLDEAAQAYLVAAQASDSIEIARRAARVNLSAQRWQDAETAISRWRELANGEPDDMRQAEALLALGQGNADLAAQRLLGLLAGGGMPATRLVSGALEAAPDRGLAIRVFERVIAAPELPKDASVLIGLSQLGLKLERNDLAEALAQRATEQLPDSAKAWFWRSRLANAAGETAQARRILEQAATANPGDVDIKRTYAVLLKTEFGDAKAAAEVLGKLPPDDETLALRAAYAVEAEDWTQAAQALQGLAALPAPRPAQRLILMGGVAESLAAAGSEKGSQAKAETQRWRGEAARWYGEIPDSADNEYPRALQRLAVLDQQAGRLDQARARLARLRESADPDSDAFIDSYLLEAELLDRDGRVDQALSVLDESLAALPRQERLQYARGLMRERANRIDDALADFRALSEAHPDNPVYLNAYGYTMADRTTRHTEAHELIERAFAMNPDDVATIDSMGWVLFKLGRHDEALAYLRQAYAEQSDGEIAAHLGEVLWVKGVRDEAREILRKALAEDGENRALKATIARLKPW